MIVIATLSPTRALARLRNRYEIIFHDCFTTVIADRLMYIGSAVERYRILICFLTTSELNYQANAKDSRVLRYDISRYISPLIVFIIKRIIPYMIEIRPLHNKSNR